MERKDKELVIKGTWRVLYRGPINHPFVDHILALTKPNPNPYLRNTRFLIFQEETDEQIVFSYMDFTPR